MRRVRAAWAAARARFLCPDAAVVPCRFEAYTEASKAVFEIFEDTAPTVEALSIDEASSTCAAWSTSPARRRRSRCGCGARVREEVGLPISVGVARTKFLAKVASAVAKPDGLLVVPPDGELEFLHPLPVERLWGVGDITAAKLHDAGLHTRSGRRRGDGSRH